MPASTVETQTVTIDKLVAGGDGLGKLETGEVVFVPGAVPGDVLEIVLAETGKLKRGNIQRVITPSVDRVPGAEPTAECDWRHIEVTAQRRWKRQIVEETLTRVGKLVGIEVAEPLAPEDLTLSKYYRNKAVFAVKQQKEGLVVGYNLPRTHTVEKLGAAETIPSVFADIARWVEKNLAQPEGVEQLQIRCNEADELVVSLIGSALDPETLRSFGETLAAQFSTVVGVDVLTGGKQLGLTGRGYLVYTTQVDDQPRQFQVSSGSFFQVNNSVLPLMLNTLAGWLPSKCASLADLYAGVGTFAIAFHHRAEKLFAVESAKSAVADSHINFDRNGCTNVAMKLGDAAKVLRDEERNVPVAILDPPRAGCSPHVLAWVNEHVTDQLIYISCDPATLARDLKVLLNDGGWTVDAIQPVDLFPQTHHVETMVNLKR